MCSCVRGCLKQPQNPNFDSPNSGTAISHIVPENSNHIVFYVNVPPGVVQNISDASRLYFWTKVGGPPSSSEHFLAFLNSQ